MTQHEVVVVGGGVSGLSFAFQAARAGRSVLVLEAEPRLGGCLATRAGQDGCWYELGAHTCYRSYAATALLLEACGLLPRVLPRARTHLRFLDGDRLLPGSNLGALLRLMRWGELARSLLSARREQREGRTVYAYYSRLVGRRNYGAVLGPMLAAVPSQSADAFPADMLFKSRRGKRRDLPRSFTLQGGLATLTDALAAWPGVVTRTGVQVTGVERSGPAEAPSFAVTTAGGARHLARWLALATPPSVTARLLREVAPELATQVARVGETTVVSTGFTVDARKVRLPPSTFLIPRDDVFHSVVTRDAVPSPGRRAFAFHFRPGIDRERRLARAQRLLGLAPADLEDVAEREARLPSPVLGHHLILREVDRLQAGSRLCVVGNWFGGLSIEDCVERSAAEWARVA